MTINTKCKHNLLGLQDNCKFCDKLIIVGEPEPYIELNNKKDEIVCVDCSIKHLGVSPQSFDRIEDFLEKFDSKFT